MYKILFIGIGKMGFPMAGFLSEKYEVSVYNRSKEKISIWKKKYGGNAVDNLNQLDEKFDFIISCIGNDDDLREITSNDTGCFNVIRKNTIFIDHSTVSPKIVQELELKLKEKEAFFLDAPISGGQLGAEKGQLSIMVGGDKNAFNKSENIFEVYGKKRKYMGSSGSGQLTKIINQICIAGLVQGLSESIYFMKQTKLNPEDVLDVISSGAAQSWQMDNRFMTMTENKFDFGFAVDLMRKDLSIAFDEAKKFGIDLEITKIVDEFYKDVQNMGGNNFDTSSLVKRLLS